MLERVDMDKKVVYYTDELTDEFSTAQITPKKIDGSYRYIRKGFWPRFTHFFWYRIIATPLAFLYLKLYFRHKIVGKECIKKDKKTGYFLFGNHTHFLADALIPTMVSTPKDTYVIVHPNNVSMPYLGRVTPSLGALPLPDDLEATKNFMRALEQRVHEKRCIMIYPEAHIWPYYTGIRAFKDTSFRYPVQFHKPVYALTNTYQKGRFLKRPRLVTYIEGPFYPEENGTNKEKRTQLRQKVYESMQKNAKNSDIVMVEYRKKENE